MHFFSLLDILRQRKWGAVAGKLEWYGHKALSKQFHLHSIEQSHKRYSSVCWKQRTCQCGTALVQLLCPGSKLGHCCWHKASRSTEQSRNKPESTAEHLTRFLWPWADVQEKALKETSGSFSATLETNILPWLKRRLGHTLIKLLPFHGRKNPTNPEEIIMLNWLKNKNNPTSKLWFVFWVWVIFFFFVGYIRQLDEG